MTSTTLLTYAPDAVIVSAGGVVLDGFADGTHVNIELDGDGTQVRRGNDGSVARSMSASRTVTITLMVWQGSQANRVLNGLWVADQVTKQGVFPILIENLTGDELFASSQTWVIKPAAQGLAQNVETRDWRLTAVLADLSKFVSIIQ